MWFSTSSGASLAYCSNRARASIVNSFVRTWWYHGQETLRAPSGTGPLSMWAIFPDECRVLRSNLYIDSQLWDDLDYLGKRSTKDSAKAVVTNNAREWVQRAKIQQDLERSMIRKDDNLGSLSTCPITAATQSRVLRNQKSKR